LANADISDTIGYLGETPMIRHRCLRPLFAALAVVATLALVVGDADARAGRGSSVGSRGMNSSSAPPPTATAPTTAAPLQRSQAQPSTPAASGNLVNQPGGFFNRPGLLGGLAAGFLGAGLLGMLFGNGLMGGLGGLASIFGLLLQVALVVIVARLAWSWWQRRNANAPAFAGASFRGTSPAQEPPAAYGGGQPAAYGGGRPAGFGTAPVTVDKADFDAFERLLGEVQVAYGAEDLNALRARVTPEMLSYFSEELAGNASRGLVNKVGQPKLLQGDLAEAWREGDSEYATVAMRYALTDAHVDRASGRVVEGDADRPVEVTEVWTFRRANGGDWLLSAIQQA
jgi:predicted lipid-binding transport protein (Tim44 family)